MRTKFRRFFRDQRGQELLEFAIVLPFLALLLAGVIEFGRAFYEYNMLTKSVRDAARYVSAAQIYSTGAFPTTPDIVVRTKNMAVYGNTAGSGSPVLPGLVPDQIDVTSSVVGSLEIYVTVSARYPFQALFSFLLRGSEFHPKETMMFVGRISYPTS